MVEKVQQQNMRPPEWSGGPIIMFVLERQTPCCYCGYSYYFFFSSYTTFLPKFARASPLWKQNAIELKLTQNAEWFQFAADYFSII